MPHEAPRGSMRSHEAPRGPTRSHEARSLQAEGCGEMRRTHHVPYKTGAAQKPHALLRGKRQSLLFIPVFLCDLAGAAKVALGPQSCLARREPPARVRAPVAPLTRQLQRLRPTAPVTP